ncbi:MAG: hypothetical protein A3F98_00510 [Candidatus Yanofskybacteria bacterium RIFCSPLOWO2_12_FULL_41_8]|uniref:Peptidase C39-like domain-containing protein n=1 Tax=Candidatus Yanofskybacteria bacterium RIFCSPHIGHO2_01_FULL_41_53 TaxID=1802663 RepID=A0A1F8EIE6_9BACT|nr:MAG: hypothetical protein A2650_01665 [Candidatus Yanofskybacteria bacterium RIFCSPHIGHO2_01_FULL_41_53]OGN17219.1 MAG: hypothetical protein A3F48_00270 [Candidatus Yanofskybacteria bacterium RIFCSPHIGHO2_12_FULL_41_9]OGN23211.1 MAG: hypothetical protein A2916_02655 [Candidatus Yanofskybacteria bacterium RIFCSPLOWO2_01_FULL_41_67]OGN33077.1 MAG: hypothetical protein A3F98_00510 [Candidatus Yanofskybacteria bacterium RIFCSPLOWO2_12_FULL_41_8]
MKFASSGVHSLPAADVVLPLKFHRQEHSLSCEAATLKMVLDYHGIDVSESEVISKIPVDATVRSGDVWGDPHVGFVGNVDGKMMIDGYGVYWEPIAVVASEWKKTGIIKNGSVSDLVGHISEGRPIIIWGYLGRGRPVSWKTPDGETVRAVNGEHTRVVYGYKGSAEKPEGFFVMDPIYGPAFWETSELLRNWDAFERMGVVVYP